MGIAPRSLADRLWSRCIRQENGCLEWTGGTNRAGYGQIGRPGVRQRKMATHRAAWEVTHGPIPEGMNVLHRCDNPPCCDPAHLFLGTLSDNSRDCYAKGRRRVVREGGRSGEAHHAAKLTTAQVAEIRRRYVRRRPGGVPPGCSQRELAAEFGVNPTAISRVVSGTRRAKG